MKYTKYIALALAIVAAMLLAGWLLRNTIIERISNPVLAQYGFTVTDVSLDALASRDARISYLEFEHQSGMVIAVEDLTLPIRTSQDGFRTYTADTVSVELPVNGAAEDSPGTVFLMQQLLALPLILPQLRVAIRSLEVSPYPAIRTVNWQLGGGEQQLSLQFDSALMHAVITQADDTNHVLRIVLSDSARPAGEQSATVDIQQIDSGFVLAGTSILDLAYWAAMSGAPVQLQSGAAALRFDTVVPEDPQQPFIVHAALAPQLPMQLDYRSILGVAASATLLTGDPFEISLSLPDFEWVVRQPDASLQVTYDDLPAMQVNVTNQSCESSLSCAGDVRLSMENAVLPFARVERLSLMASQELTIDGDVLGLRVLPNASLVMAGISADDVTLQRLDASLTSAAAVTLGSGGWQFFAESIDTSLAQLSIVDGLSYSAPLFLDKVSVSQQGNALAMQLGVYASANELSWGERLLRIPGFSGGLSRQGSEMALFLKSDGLQEQADIEISHNLDRKSGRLAVKNAVVSFDTSAMSTWVSPWTNEWDVSAGTLAVELDADWRSAGDEWLVTADTTLQMSGLAGAYKDTAFVGLSSRIGAHLRATDELTFDPATVAIDLLEIGLPVRNITADYRAFPDDGSVAVDKLNMELLGGVISAEPFSFGTARASNTFNLKAESIDLGRILSLQEFESIEVSGRIGATLPVKLENETVTISGGRVSGEPPGGVIRYLPGRATDKSDVSALGVATRALSNFEYDSLTSELDYTVGGDLKLQMRLAGRNPDLQDNRPVVLNLGVENNVPQMLRSLRAARAVEEILERRMAQ